ncbi:hypothetical protein QAD02_017931 [Eretmocerus hayati]|uniref:Uncharacterized protein n=1 Tax=Eretmocerus hayati TaxID=131215 RepID=A0ACC2PFQ4_9HYME|nr:hypothetical protein QAD02_017931 [Eretmocerus hayati]
MKLSLVLLVISIVRSRSIEGPKCEISIDYKKGDLKEPQPLILTDSDEPDFILPNDQKQLIFNKNSSVILACLGFKNGLQGFGNKQYLKATCVEGKEFIINNTIQEFSKFKCSSLPKEIVRKTKSRCLENKQLYEIGYQIKQNFLPLMSICRDDDNLSTHYTNATVVQEITGFQSSFPRPNWKHGQFYSGYNMISVYKQKSQLKSMEILLGSKELAQKYIQNEQYLNRGHLAAKADFVFGSHQSTTFWLLNTAPQWSTFNAGNWLIIESSVRDFAATRKKDLNIYTGLHGISYLNDINGNRQDLYLHVNETHKAFPVPMFFWKVVHEPVDNLAVAFVGVNNPYLGNITQDLYLCTDLSRDPAFAWIKWKPTEIKLGVSYICQVDELRRSIPTIPDIGKVGLLT